MRRVRAVTEAAVIAEFLKNEFYRPEFQPDRHVFEHLVLDGNLEDARENAIRRALLFRRRGHMWRELPPDTEWWEVALDIEDLQRIHVFPRAHWRKIASGSFKLADIARRIRSERFRGRTQTFVSKIEALSYRLREQPDHSAILLITTDEQSPVTILEGNHRLTAALLASPSILQQRFRVLCGFSARMSESCWYRTSITNLWRYAWNRFRNLYDREADLERVLPQYAREQAPNLPQKTAAQR
ncbi:MAG: hypothetical protein JO041_16595 [Acidobacteria bacterium]|nr:hypothetical protein [Acidobacteriota bacterium]